MELKQQLSMKSVGLGKLLIVPYGIETERFQAMDVFLSSLLIVPYGIETFQRPGKGIFQHGF